MSGDSADLAQLANVLRHNGDKVLNALSKLSLNALLLQKLNREFDLLQQQTDGVTGEGEPCQVAKPNTQHGNTQLMKDLQFLHDFVQKTIGLKLTNNRSLTLLNNRIDISKFKNIKYLEIKKIPVREVIGLSSVQSQLESIVCIRCLTAIEELLSRCGGDDSPGVVWSELREAILSFNQIKTVDTSIALAPWLQVLDLSHNQIEDIKAIECLPNLKYINLSFNCLSAIPTFNKSAKKKIELLVMKNNYVEDLSGLTGLSHLTEVDLSNNWITDWDSFNTLLPLSTLQLLSLIGNPISCQSSYRQRVAGYLHISASFSDFYLDKVKLSKKEKSIVGIKLSDNPLMVNSNSVDVSRTRRLSSPVTGGEQVGSTKKSGKARLVAIPNLDDGTYEETPSYTNSLEFLNSSTEHLITKKRIENTRSAYGVDNWLVQGSSIVQDILGLPPAEVSTSTPCDDMCLKAALDSVRNVVTTVAVIEPQPDLPATEEVERNYSFVTCNEGDTMSNYFSAETSAEKEDEAEEGDDRKLESEVGKEEAETSSKEVSPDIEPIQEEDESEELDEVGKVYVVLRETKTYQDEVTEEELFLTVTDTELQEREAIRGKIVTKWCLTSLESCVKLKPTKFQLVFDTVRRDKRERIYSLDEPEATALYKQLVEILESRTLSDMNQIVYKCENCDSQFSAEIKSGKRSNDGMCCPSCHSKFILQLDEVPVPSSDAAKKAAEVQKGPETRHSHNRSSSVGGFFQSFLSQNDSKILKCSSQSSIGSAASLNQMNESAISNAMKRTDSDIEILSNPSQSSIEVIDGPAGRLANGSTPRRKRSSEERQSLLQGSLLAAAANSIQNNPPPAGLTESSSSGSVTDSICTAYETASGDPSTPATKSTVNNNNDSNKEITKESETDTDKRIEPILQDVLDDVGKACQTKTPLNSVKYSYTDFTKIDHRIKLFLYTHVFDDASEEFAFGIRATVSVHKTDYSFPSCVIASNRKLYLLKVTNPEQGDDARKFLQKVDSLSFSLTAVKYIYTLTWYQGFCLKIQQSNNKWKQCLLLLMDTKKTKNFLNFIMSDCTVLGDAVIVPDTLEKPYLSVQQLLFSSVSVDDTSIRYFSLFRTCSVRTDRTEDNFTVGGILTNSSDLLLLAGDLNWFFDEVASQQPNLKHCQKFRNLSRVYTGQSRIIFQFVHDDGRKEEEEEVWTITMERGDSAGELLKFVKESWETTFSAPFKLSYL